METMALSLVQHIKARTRSVQIDKSTAFDVAGLCPLESGSPGTRANHRLSSLSVGDENFDPMTPKAALVPPSALRRYRSMLEVEDPPKLSPWKPMSFDELYAGPIQGTDDDDADVHSPEPPIPQAKAKRMTACCSTESTSQATLGLSLLPLALPSALCTAMPCLTYMLICFLFSFSCP